MLRRSVMASEELPLIGNNKVKVRSKSAPHSQEEHATSKGHPSIARFCDWSDDLSNCISVSRLYREFANIPRRSLDKSSKVKAVWATVDGTNEVKTSVTSGTASRHYAINSGRMFVRDKRTLTRGEREIIEGIYKNRGDIARDSIDKSELWVRSHHEAWYVGKAPFGNTRLKGWKIDELPSGPCPHLNMEKASASLTSLELLHGATATTSQPVSQQSLQKDNNVTNVFRVRKPILQLPDQNCQICQAQQDARDMVLWTNEAQNEHEWNDETPSAPPGTPDEAAVNHLTQQYPLFGKLLNMRPILSFPPILLTDGIRTRNRSHTQTIESYEQKFPHNKSATKSVNDPSFKGAPVFLRLAKHGLSVLSMHSTMANPCHVTNTEAKTLNSSQRVDDYESENDTIYNSANSAFVVANAKEEKGSERTNRDTKKVQVKVYLPTAENDHGGDGFISVLHPLEEVS